MIFANVVPKQRSPIPWGWSNATIDVNAVGLPSKMTFVEKPLGEIRMPSLVDHFDWSTWTIEGLDETRLDLGTLNFKSVFTTAARFLGYERLLSEMPSLHSITGGLLEWNEKLLDLVGGHLSYFLIGDDIAGNDGLLMSPHDFKYWILPNYLRLIDLTRGLDLRLIFHSDGDISKILHLLAEAGFWGVSYQPIGGMKEIGPSFNGLVMLPVEDQARENEETLRLQRGEKR